MSDDLRAELIEAQARIADLSNSNERLREERDSARTSVDLLLHDAAEKDEIIKQHTATIDRLRLALSQGSEL